MRPRTLPAPFSALRQRLRLRWLLLGLLVLGVCGCQTLPTATPLPLAPTGTAKPEQTHTRTAQPTLPPTATPLPHYLDLQPEDVEGLQIRLWHAQRDDVKQTLDKLIAEFNQTNPYGLTVTAHAELSDSLMNDALLKPPANDAFPHIILAESPWLKYWQSKKLPMVLLQNYIDHPQWGIAAQGIEPILPEMTAQETYGGNFTALPLWHNPSFLFYNNAFGQILGFSQPPATLSEFEEQACAALQFNNSDADPGNDGTGGWIQTKSVAALVSWMISQYPEETELSSFPEEGSPEQFIGTVGWLRGLYDKGCVWQSRRSLPYDYFAGHDALLYSGSFADIPMQKLAFSQSAANQLDDWQLIPYPTAAEGAEPQVFSTAVAAGIFTGTAQEQFAAWLFLSWLMQDDRLSELAVAAEAWPVQDTGAIRQRYQTEADAKLAQTLKWIEQIRPQGLSADWVTDSLVLSDGFGYAFSAGSDSDKIPSIWEQIQSTVNELKQIN